MNFTEYVEAEKKKIRLENISQLRKEIDSSWVKEKIDNHILSFSNIFSKDEIKTSILNNDIVASFFIKDPGRQNISEKLALEILQVEKLPSQGKNCIRFNDEGKIVSIASNNTKSADFIWKDYYVTQKYTDSMGGAQDNQRNDVIDFLKRGSIQHKVAAIVDGKYWDVWRDKLKEEFKDNQNVLITSVTEITENI